MNYIKFGSMAKRANMSEGTATYHACYLHLVHNYSRKEACDEAGVNKSTLSKALKTMGATKCPTCGRE